MGDTFHITDYLTYLEVELGLSHNTIEAYLHNVNRYVSYLSENNIFEPGNSEKSVILDFIESLRSAGADS